MAGNDAHRKIASIGLVARMAIAIFLVLFAEALCNFLNLLFNKGKKMTDQDKNEAIARLAADWWASRLESPSVNVALFTDKLQSLIAAELENSEKVYVKTDYDPDDMLTAALEAGGVTVRGMFSARGVIQMKSTTIVSKWGVEIKDGYGNLADPIVPEWSDKKE